MFFSGDIITANGAILPGQQENPEIIVDRQSVTSCTCYQFRESGFSSLSCSRRSGSSASMAHACNTNTTGARTKRKNNGVRRKTSSASSSSKVGQKHYTVIRQPTNIGHLLPLKRLNNNQPRTNRNGAREKLHLTVLNQTSTYMGAKNAETGSRSSSIYSYHTNDDTDHSSNSSDDSDAFFRNQRNKQRGASI